MENIKLHQYLEQLIPKKAPLFEEMEQYAVENRVPIMDRIGIESMLQILRIKQPKTILEIGTAIGYSSLRMADVVREAKIVTIERNEEMFERAQSYVRRAGKEEQIRMIKGDALEVKEEVEIDAPFDVIFIDAAKGQYKKFFELYSPLLNDHGLVITDNVLFRGLVLEEKIENRRLKGMVNKIKEYNEWVMNHPSFDSVILPIGDGVTISRKR